ncbi:hypothetical protein YC2023_099136 [Brassica napus]
MDKAPFSDWLQFTDRLLDRFAGSSDTEPVSEIAPMAATLCSPPELLPTQQSTPRVLIGAISTDAAELSDNGFMRKKVCRMKPISTIDPENDSTELLSVSHVNDVDGLYLNVKDEVVLQTKQVSASVLES